MNDKHFVKRVIYVWMSAKPNAPARILPCVLLQSFHMFLIYPYNRLIAYDNLGMTNIGFVMLVYIVGHSSNYIDYDISMFI